MKTWVNIGEHIYNRSHSNVNFVKKDLVEMENVRNMNVCIMRECIYMWVLSQNILPKWKHDWTGTYILKCNCCNNWFFEMKSWLNIGEHIMNRCYSNVKCVKKYFLAMENLRNMNVCIMRKCIEI